MLTWSRVHATSAANGLYSRAQLDAFDHLIYDFPLQSSCTFLAQAYLQGNVIHVVRRPDHDELVAGATACLSLWVPLCSAST